MNLKKLLQEGKIEEFNNKLRNYLSKLPIIEQDRSATKGFFDDYHADRLMKETAKLRKLITKRGTQ